MTPSSAVWRALILAGVAVAAAPRLGAQAPQPQPQPQPQAPAPLPLGPARERGASITPAFEGWYQNEDGTYNLLVGYYNRNRGEALDIPVGPNNRVEPGPADQGQPTHFEVGRQWGVFVVKVPKDFGTKTLTWTITANGETNSVPLTLHKGYTVEPFQESGMGNKPPVFWFASGGPKFTGPPGPVATTLAATANQPLAFSVWVEDPKEIKKGLPPSKPMPGIANISFHKFRGPGAVTFDPAKATVAKQGDPVATKATFSVPGEYLLRVQGNDESGEGGAGFQCCWTNTYVKVTVK